MIQVISRVHPVYLTNVEQRQAAADPQTKPTDLGCESTCRLLLSTSIMIMVDCSLVSGFSILCIHQEFVYKTFLYKHRSVDRPPVFVVVSVLFYMQRMYCLAELSSDNLNFSLVVLRKKNL